MGRVTAVSSVRDADGVLVADCPQCGDELVLHQPDPGRPDRLLATCKVCHAWFLTTAGLRPLDLIPGTGPGAKPGP
jgi:hypothetical protein